MSKRIFDSNYEDWKVGDKVVWELKRNICPLFTIAKIEHSKVFWEGAGGTNRTECDNLLRVTGDDEPSCPRDIQFQGFAELLARELKACGLLDIGNASKPLLDPPVDLDYEKVKQIIARWAYDLVEHAMGFVSEAMGAKLEVELMSSEEAANEIPDLTELPKEQE